MNIFKILAFTLLGITIILLMQDAYAEFAPNNAFSLAGAGFVVSEKSIQTSQLDLFLSTTKKTGSNTNFVIDDGVISLNNQDFTTAKLSGTILRDGRFISLQGTAKNPIGDEISVKFFGRLIEESTEGSVYGFTGSLTQDGKATKVIYTTKVSMFEKITKPTSTNTPQKTKDVIVHILKGSSDPNSVTYTEKLGQAYTSFSFYSKDRITTEPGTTITFVNDDVVSHSVTSGSGLGSHGRFTGTIDQGKQFACELSTLKAQVSGSSYAQKNCSFIIDGKISSGNILPGGQWSVTVNEMGFYRLVDLDYPWMSIVIYVFPQSSSVTIGAPNPDAVGKN